MNDDQRIEKFLEEFSSKLGNKFSKDLDFILLFGSVARDEWKRGISDVDLIIQLKNLGVIEDFKKYTNEIFWELDKKYDTKFKEVCSIGNQKDELKKLLEKTKLYVPYEIFEPGDIDWEKGHIKRKDLQIGAQLVASQAMLFHKMKHEGKILYGRDIRKIIKAKATWWEKIKAILIPYHIALATVFGALIFPKTSLKMAVKSVIYAIESTLFFLDKPIGKGIKRATADVEKELKRKVKLKQNIFGIMEVDLLLNFNYHKLVNFDFISEALYLKYNWEKEFRNFSRLKTLVFCWKALFFVNAMNWYAILSTDKRRIIFKIIFIIRSVLLLLVIWWFLF